MGNAWQPFSQVLRHVKAKRVKEGAGPLALVGAVACLHPRQTVVKNLPLPKIWHRRESRNSCFSMVQCLLPRRTERDFVHFKINLVHPHTSPASLLKDSALCKEVTRGWGFRVKTEGSIFFIP